MAQVSLSDLISQARGDAPADLVLRGGQVFDVVTGDMIPGDVAICGDTVAGIGGAYEGREVVDVTGLTLVPGFIDTHLHIESSLITPHEFDRCVTPRGITTVICDPHEIANVLGVPGIEYSSLPRPRPFSISACSFPPVSPRPRWKPPARGSTPRASRR